jgi:hypothetical protein
MSWWMLAGVTLAILMVAAYLVLLAASVLLLGRENDEDEDF